MTSIKSAVALLVLECHTASSQAGWWKGPGNWDIVRLIRDPKSDVERYIAGAFVAQKLALQHSEISEGLEGHRKGKMDEHLPHRPSLEVELADAVIRICDLAGAMDLDLSGAVVEKLAYNAQRPDHKPENRAKSDGKKY